MRKRTVQCDYFKSAKRFDDLKETMMIYDSCG